VNHVRTCDRRSTLPDTGGGREAARRPTRTPVSGRDDAQERGAPPPVPAVPARPRVPASPGFRPARGFRRPRFRPPAGPGPARGFRARPRSRPRPRRRGRTTLRARDSARSLAHSPARPQRRTRGARWRSRAPCSTMRRGDIEGSSADQGRRGCRAPACGRRLITSCHRRRRPDRHGRTTTPAGSPRTPRPAITTLQPALVLLR